MTAMRRSSLQLSDEGDAVTTLELFFDLVYVFAFTQVTGLMSQGTGSVVDGLIVFALLWWTWCSYAWLANMARADRGMMRLALLTATATMFIACLAIPEAFGDLPGGLDGPLVLVACYAVVRLLHIAVYLVAAGDDRALRRQVLVSLATSAVPAAALLTIGVLLPNGWQRPLWLVAVIYDLVVIFVTSRGGGGWVVRSAAHFSERHGLVVMLALGESVVAIGVGAAQKPVSAPIVVAAGLAVAVAVGVWLLYFLDLAVQLEHRFGALEGRERARAARDVFTYLHLPIVAGIVIGALGIEQAVAHLEDGYLGTLGAWSLCGGLAMSVVAMAAASRRLGGRWSVWRLGLAAVLVAMAPLLADAQPWLALAVVATALIGTAVAAHLATNPD
jgi:low temperature requirement protein LtrA